MQYRESDFNFVSRLMEQEGIFYFFKHEQRQAHAGAGRRRPWRTTRARIRRSARYSPRRGEGQREDAITDAGRSSSELRPGKLRLRDYHFQMPSKSLEAMEPHDHRGRRQR